MDSAARACCPPPKLCSLRGCRRVAGRACARAILRAWGEDLIVLIVLVAIVDRQERETLERNAKKKPETVPTPEGVDPAG